MALPLAHPAGALLFRRLCPRYLSFAGLLIGSLSPDLGNCLNVDIFAHSLLGTLAFLPFTLVWLSVFFSVRRALASTFPEPHRHALLPLCNGEKPPFLVCTISLLLGSWTHLIWDLFTHDHSRLAQTLGVLAFEAPGAGTVHLKVSRLLWVVTTCCATGWLLWSYTLFLKRTGSNWVSSRPELRRYAFWSILFLVVLLISTAPVLIIYRRHDLPFFLRAVAEFYLTIGFLSLGTIGFCLKLPASSAGRPVDSTPSQPGRPSTPPVPENKTLSVPRRS